MALSVGPSGRVPAGEATLLVGFDPATPVSVMEKVSRRNAREGVLVAVHADQPPARIEYTVGRTESTPEPVALTLNPAAFYRGHFYPADRGVDVTMDSSRNPVAVTIQQSYEGLKFRDFTDQFKEHPGQGYLHYGTYLQYKLVLTAELPMKVWVRYGYKEHPESYQTKPLEIGPGRRGEIQDVVKASDFPLVKSGEHVDPAPLNMLVTIWKEKVNGEIVGKSKYTFQMIPPSRYISTAAEFEPGTRTLSIWVTHLANDPVTGPVEILASIGGRVERDWIRRSKIAPFEFRVPPGAKSVTWRVGIESIPAAFRETIETPSLSAAGEAAQ
jgi:hypothetical protein